MRTRPLGRSAAGAGIPEEQKSGARLDTERQTGVEEHNQQFLRPADRVSNLRLPAHDQLRRDQRTIVLDSRRTVEFQHYKKHRVKTVAKVRVPERTKTKFLRIRTVKPTHFTRSKLTIQTGNYLTDIILCA